MRYCSLERAASSTLVWSYTHRACMCCTWQGSVVSDSSHSSGRWRQIWSAVVPLFLDEGLVSGWLRAFINLINFLIYSALTFESITSVCDFPASYRPVLPAGSACQVVLKTNSTSVHWRELLPQSRWSINKQLLVSLLCLFVCFKKSLYTEHNTTPTAVVVAGCLPGPDRDTPASGVLSLFNAGTSISPSLFHISQLLERRLLLSCTPSKYAFLWGLQIPADPGITFSRIPSWWGWADPCLPCSVSEPRHPQPGLCPGRVRSPLRRFLPAPSHGSAMAGATYGKGRSGLWYVPVMSQNTSICLHSSG